MTSWAAAWTPIRMYLYEGRPGTGKTTIALQFLLEGVRDGERVLYISLSETKAGAQLSSRSRHGWSLDGVDIFELVPPETTLDPERELTVFPSRRNGAERNHRADLQGGRTDQSRPRGARQPVRAAPACPEPAPLPAPGSGPEALLHQPQLHCRPPRRSSSSQDDLQLHSIAHGVVMLEQLAIDYGAERRRLRVIKMRGIRFRGGLPRFYDRARRLADLPAPRGGRASASRFPVSSRQRQSPNSINSWEAGFERGTNALLIGAAGVGKSSLALTYAIAAAERGEHAAFLCLR